MKIAVVIPCFKVKTYILSVISKIGLQVDKIYVVDDFCPQKSGAYVQDHCFDSRVTVIFHTENKGVGGAVISGYKYALDDNCNIVVKVDGDGQMDPKLIPKLVSPILKGDADYVKGNRFFDLDVVFAMPKVRLIGNTILSFINKICSGYWNIMDPTNGYTAIHSNILKSIPLHKIDNRYFFESDMLFRLSLIRAVVLDFPMKAKYGDEISNLKVNKILLNFIIKYTNRFLKRIFYNYFLRNFNIGSIELLATIILILSGSIYGIMEWYISFITKIPASSGKVMLAALPIILGFQCLLGVINYDIANLPKIPIHEFLED